MNQYLYYFGVFDLYAAGLVIIMGSFLLVSRKVTNSGRWLIYALFCLALVELRKYLEGTGVTFYPQTWRYALLHLSYLTPLVPALLYNWVRTNSGLKPDLKWYYVIPYLMVGLLFTRLYWPQSYTSQPLAWHVNLCWTSFWYLAPWLYFGLKLRKAAVKWTTEYKLLAGVALALVALERSITHFWTYNNLFGWELDITLTYIPQPLFMGLFFFFMAFYLYGKRNTAQRADAQKAVNRPGVKARPEILEAFTEQALYLDPGIKVESAAKKLAVSKAVLSKTFSETEEGSFNDFLNRCRLDHFMQLVAEEAYVKLSIMGMAESAGFKSKATFNRIFKARVGMTPSAFIEKQRDENTPVAINGTAVPQATESEL